MNNKFDVIVVGAGHAGVEAALASARMNANTLMLVIKYESIGRMSCNPSIGGPAKGHLAREIDALGGEIAHIADLTGIQFRMLNKSKGPAVWAPRSQNDRLQYSIEMRNVCEATDNLQIVESIVDEIIVDDNHIKGIKTNLGESFFAPKVILANGTFLKGKIYVGSVNFAGGRSGEPSSEKLSESLKLNGFRLSRFKTGTPPRIDLNTMNINKVEEQPGDPNPEGFSYYRDIKIQNKVSCYLTFTNPQTHEIINGNLNLSSLYGGYISGIGPRYCPSIEDKIVKFNTKNRHHVFIEPEGIETNEAYVNGISNSLPPYIQQRMLNSIAGLEKAKIIRYGYAIEYDYISPEYITRTMETKLIKGLYFVGQINGTSGYEEAAAQGIVAGINAVLDLNNAEPLLLNRANSYIGVLIDDLITRGTNEPYRMFTSRAEYRLFLRQDNADVRLMPIGYKLGLVSDNRWKQFQTIKSQIDREIENLKNTKSNKNPRLSEPTRLIKLLKRPEISFDELSEFGYEIPIDLSSTTKNRISLLVKYDGYLKRQIEDIKRFKENENKKIPDNIDYMKIQPIAYEAREKLQKFKPTSLGEASRIPGVNQTDVTALMVYLKKHWKK
ncbi:MAG: tRNA uridine-5-carboxymethylaminomethyl(34) synthesis enzyme MnmG [Candidatus Cloacimonadota bacterium]|nr:tRNA uridine-5-carboxymethylaminomethyl(34) synthesis enzyme MnmG [Candidatus Cloacimonadota bacterium]